MLYPFMCLQGHCIWICHDGIGDTRLSGRSSSLSCSSMEIQQT
jgi:hypothetical protein